jgi:hypothetical protein
MNINMLLWWSLGRGNTVVPSRWRATRDCGVSGHLEDDEIFLANHGDVLTGTISSPSSFKAVRWPNCSR